MILILPIEDQWPATNLSLSSVRAVVPQEIKAAVLLQGSDLANIEGEMENLFPVYRFYSNPPNTTQNLGNPQETVDRGAAVALCPLGPALRPIILH